MYITYPTYRRERGGRWDRFISVFHRAYIKVSQNLAAGVWRGGVGDGDDWTRKTMLSYNLRLSVLIGGVCAYIHTSPNLSGDIMYIFVMSCICTIISVHTTTFFSSNNILFFCLFVLHSAWIRPPPYIYKKKKRKKKAFSGRLSFTSYFFSSFLFFFFSIHRPLLYFFRSTSPPPTLYPFSHISNHA